MTTRQIPDLRRSLVLALILLAVACVGLVEAYHPQKSNTERTTEYNEKGELVNVEKTYENGRLIERKEFDPTSGKLRKRIGYKYVKGFKQPDTSETRYAPDGKTVTGTTNVDHDKDGEPTSTTTTEYDETGKETGGSKRERDSATGKQRCYNWNSTKQAYEEIECPKIWVSGVSMNNNMRPLGGLQSVVFDTSAGAIHINLPDDMMAGDTISGTVVVEPRGSSEQERANNQDVLSGYVVEIGNQKVPASNSSFIWNIPISSPDTQPGFRVTILESSSNKHVADTPIPVQAAITSRGDQGPRVITGGDYAIPNIGQTGRPVTIRGNFDGNADNTRVMVGSQSVPVVVESPRKIVVQSPSSTTGSTEMTVKEGDNEAKSPYRNIGVNLSAPKTTLRKGESTDLRVEVTGLQGLSQSVPLHLTNGGAVTMSGGNSQTMTIKPSDVQNGIYTTARTITGTQTGGWTATATVVVFNICIQDDTDPSRILLFDLSTGDFSFCPGAASGAKQPPIGTFPLDDFAGGVIVRAGDGIDSAPGPGRILVAPGVTMTKLGTITSADFKFNAAQIHLELNQFSNVGSATVATTNPKQSFTITDRDTRNNTCACR